MESILVIILLLATHTAVGTARERPKDEDPCQSASFAREINSYCVNRVSPTSTCCESAIASVDIEGSGTAPCLCRVAAEPQLIMAGLNTTDLLVIFASCRALALGGAPLEATCEGDQLAIGKETGRLLGMGTNNMYPSSALLGQNKDEPIADLPVDDLIEKDDGFAAILNDGTIMTISKDRVKPSPLPDSWKLAEIFTTGTVLRGYLTIMTVIFFWAAFKTKKIPRIFHVKSLEKTAQDDFQMLASAVYLQVSTISQALIFFTRWQEFRFKSIFSLSEQRSDPHVPVYNLSRNHDIGYSAFHSVHRKELTRFIIIIIIILGVLFSAICPVQAAAPIINVDLKFDPQGYVGWSHDLYTVGTSLSQLEFTSTRQKVLGQQTFPHEPPAWIHVNVSDATEWAKFIMRSDNYQLSAYENREATHSFEEATHLFPGSIDIGFSGSYSGLNGGRRNLTDLNLNMDSAKLALWILSRYKHGVSDPFLMKRALTIYVLIFEGQRFTEVDTCIKDGWNSDCYLTRPHELLVNWGTLSCGILEGWEPNPRHDDWWVKSREKTYRKALKDLQITETQAPGLLRVLVMGKACQDNIKGVHCITGNGASCSIRA